MNAALKDPVNAPIVTEIVESSQFSAFSFSREEYSNPTSQAVFAVSPAVVELTTLDRQTIRAVIDYSDGQAILIAATILFHFF